MAFNSQFELARLKECCDSLPEFRPWLKNVSGRMVDLLLPFRGFHYYHTQQNGSASTKAVLPALTGRGYDHLAIQEGGDASRSVRRQLEEYCGQDTLGMVWIVDALRRLV